MPRRSTLLIVLFLLLVGSWSRIASESTSAPAVAGLPGEASATTETPLDTLYPRVTGAGPLVSESPPFPLVETYLAVSPVDPENLLASAMSTSADRSVVYRSGDGGRTWQRSEGPGGPVFPGGDPMLVYDRTGRAYFSTILPEIAVWRSEDDGRTWQGPVLVGEDRASDRQWVAAGGRGGDGPVPVWVVAKTPEDGGGGRDQIILSRSRDGGATFTNPTLIPLDSGYLNAVTHLAVREEGTLLLPFLANYGRLPGPEDLIRGTRWILMSEEGSGSWEGPFLVAENLQYGNRNWERAMKGLGGGGLAVDESGGPDHGTIYMTWAAVIGGHLQIVLARSPDGGRSWSEPVRVNDGGFDVDHSTPTVAVSGEGVVAVTWNDRRGDSGGRCFRHYVALSADGGRTFGPNRPVSDQRTCFRARSRWLNGGDTQGLVALPDGSFRTVWTVGHNEGSRPWSAVIRTR